MTNLQYLCHNLRECGQADAAQTLELWSPEDWVIVSSGRNVHLEEHKGSADAAHTLDRLFSWNHTREGDGYWGEMHCALLEHDLPLRHRGRSRN